MNLNYSIRHRNVIIINANRLGGRYVFYYNKVLRTKLKLSRPMFFIILCLDIDI